MSRQLLMYENAAAVSVERHKDWSLAPIESYGFARHTNAVPLVLAEFNAALSDYLIVFVDAGDSVQPVAVVGVRPDENLYIDADGKWSADYIPAFVRRYPFVFARLPDDERLALCVDESHDGWNTDGRGERLFDDEGERSAYLQGALDFAENYHRQFELTRAFGRKLKSLDLLEPASARIALPGGGNAALRGFMAVSREKLKSLPGSSLVELMLSEAMELIYTHLISLKNTAPLQRRLGSLASKGSGTGQAPAKSADRSQPKSKAPAKKAPAKAKQKEKAAAKKAPAKKKSSATKARSPAKKK